MKLCFHSNHGYFILAGRRLWDKAAYCSAPLCLLSSTLLNYCCIITADHRGFRLAEAKESLSKNRH